MFEYIKELFGFYNSKKILGEATHNNLMKAIDKILETETDGEVEFDFQVIRK